MAGDAAMPQHHAAMGQRPDLVELVRDEDDAEPLGRHGAQRHEQAVDLAGASTAVGSSRISILRAAKQRLDDFQPLLLAHRQRRDRTVRDRASARMLRPISLEPRQAAGAVDPAAPCPGMPISRFSSTRQPRRQMEMLVHHADAGGERIGRADWMRTGLPSTRISPASAA